MSIKQKNNIINMCHIWPSLSRGKKGETVNVSAYSVLLCRQLMIQIVNILFHNANIL